MITRETHNWTHIVMSSPLNDGLTKEQRETLINFLQEEQRKEREELRNANRK